MKTSDPSRGRRRLWIVGLVVWALALAAFHGRTVLGDWRTPPKLVVNIDMRPVAGGPFVASVRATGRARDLLDGRLESALSDGIDSFRFTPRARMWPSDWEQESGAVLAIEGRELLPEYDDLRAFEALLELEVPHGLRAFWLSEHLEERQSSGSDVWRIPARSLLALDRALLVLGSQVTQSVGPERIVAIGRLAPQTNGVSDLVSLVDRWRSELDAVLPRSADPLTILAVCNPNSEAPISVRQGDGYVLVPVHADNLHAREVVHEAVALARLRAGEQLESEVAWIDPAIARRIALALAPHAMRPDRWRDLLAYRVFLASTYEAPLANVDRAEDRAYDYLARLKGPHLLRRVEQAADAGEYTDAGEIAHATEWARTRDRVARGNSLRSAIRAGVHAAGVEALDRLDGGSRELGLEPFAKDLDLRSQRSSTAATTSRIALVVTADTENFLETCGCRILQAGGIARRAALVKRIVESRPTLVVDLGNVFPRHDPEDFDEDVQGDVRVQVEADRLMGVAVHVLGPNELFQGLHFLDELGSAFQGVNVRRADGAATSWSRETPLFEIGAQHVRVMPIAPRTPYWIDPGEWRRRTAAFEVEDPVTWIRRSDQPRDKSELLVVAGSIPTWRIPDLLEGRPDIDVVVSSDRRVLASSPGRKDEDSARRLRSGFAGDTLVLLANEESHGFVVFELEIAADGRIAEFREQEVLLSPDLDEDPAIRDLLDAHYARPGRASAALATPLAGFAEERALAGAGAARHDATPQNGAAAYVGSSACRACHPAEYALWEATPHATAFRTLEEKRRSKSAACVRCHVVGFGLAGGFEQDAAPLSRDLRGVGCEVCHGPGRAHAIDHPGDPTRIRHGLDRAGCEACHDADHSTPLEGRAVDPFDIGAHRPHRKDPR